MLSNFSKLLQYIPSSSPGFVNQQDRWEAFQFSRSVFPDQKRTGLEAYSTLELVQAVTDRRSFWYSWTQNGSFFEWDHLLDQGARKVEIMERFWEALDQRLLKCDQLIELGIGTKYTAHKEYFDRHYQPKQFSAVERFQVEGQDYSDTVIEDMLIYLEQQPEASGHICAFGVFNEPLSPDASFTKPAKSLEKAAPGHLQHEYLRRLAREVARVLPEDGIIFGIGLHPLRDLSGSFSDFRKQAFESYLRCYGLSPLEEVQEDLEACNEAMDTDIFLLRKVPELK